MHRYSVNSESGQHTIVYLGFISVALAWLLAALLEKVGIAKLAWIESPSVLGIYGLLYYLFDRYGWRLGIARKFGWVGTPDLRGAWSGVINSSFDSSGNDFPVSANIAQTWSHISISLSTDNSTSISEAAAIVPKPDGGASIIYVYSNEPRTGSVATLHAHSGTARLEFTREKSGELLSGHYYSGRDRQNMGTIELRRSRVVAA